MMGAGKTSVGLALARRLALPFVDTDAEVERESGCRVTEIFARKGEAHFRELERAAIERTGARNAVVALGGGAPAQRASAELIARSGVRVYLRARPETLALRVGDASERPLLAGRDLAGRVTTLRELLAARQASYECAELVIDTDALDPDAVAARVAAQICAKGAQRA
jgi:shikimate kinase